MFFRAEEPSTAQSPDDRNKEDVHLLSCVERKYTYIIKTQCITVLKCLVWLCHEANPLSDAYAIRRHPHDTHVEACFSKGEASKAVRDLEFTLASDINIFCSDGDENMCYVEITKPFIANVVRRALMSLVDVMACTHLDMKIGDASCDEAVVANRLGQLAIVSEASSAKAILRGKGPKTLKGKDIFFEDDAAACISALDLEAPLVLLQSKASFIDATLYFKRGIPLEHAKFHSVVAPSFCPKIYVSRAPLQDELDILSRDGFEVSDSGLVKRGDGRPVRLEALRESLPCLDLRPCTEVVVGVESLGQYTAETCVRKALQAILTEAKRLEKRFTAFDTEDVPGASCDALEEIVPEGRDSQKP